MRGNAGLVVAFRGDWAKRGAQSRRPLRLHQPEGTRSAITAQADHQAGRGTVEATLQHGTEIVQSRAL